MSDQNQDNTDETERSERLKTGSKKLQKSSCEANSVSHSAYFLSGTSLAANIETKSCWFVLFPQSAASVDILQGSLIH